MEDKIREILLALLAERSKQRGEIMLVYDESILDEYVEKIINIKEEE